MALHKAILKTEDSSLDPFSGVVKTELKLEPDLEQCLTEQALQSRSAHLQSHLLNCKESVDSMADISKQVVSDTVTLDHTVIKTEAPSQDIYCSWIKTEYIEDIVEHAEDTDSQDVCILSHRNFKTEGILHTETGLMSNSAIKTEVPSSYSQMIHSEVDLKPDPDGEDQQGFSDSSADEQLHTSERTYGCQICKKKFYEESNLKIHLRVHNGEKPYECEICKQRFIKSSYLKKHLRIHTGVKPNECEICKKRFSKSCDLNIHLRVHTGEKPYECEICMKRFIKSYNLKRHMRIHDVDKPYECEICKKRFTINGSLKRHLRRHAGDKSYECEICKKRFNQSANLKQHSLKHTRDTLMDVK